MKQQELIHLHALLFEVGEYIKRDDTSTIDPFARYETQSTRPYHVHRRKDAHTTAINHLLHGSTRFVRTSRQHTQTASPETTTS